MAEINPGREHNGKKAAAAAGVGAAVGAGTSTYLGGIGLTAMGTGIGIGVGPLIVAGSIVGLAGYGIYRAFKK